MGAILIRPRRIPEALFAGAGAALLVVAHLISPLAALHAIEKGVAVYLFLIGMMALAELARHEGVFDWIAAFALEAARGSQARLFALVFGVGVVVTAILSNDATAVVLTPAIAATIARARVPPLPYLFACAFVANAASFVLPISNPANLVVFGDALPALGPWLAAFGIPALLAIAATFAALRFEWRTSLAAPCAQPGGAPPLSPA
ncbi:MAG: SLC13 family permease, partial [Vulcanimicrobiaceae bacterium]